MIRVAQRTPPVSFCGRVQATLRFLLCRFLLTATRRFCATGRARARDPAHAHQPGTHRLCLPGVLSERAQPGPARIKLALAACVLFGAARGQDLSKDALRDPDSLARPLAPSSSHTRRPSDALQLPQVVACVRIRLASHVTRGRRPPRPMRAQGVRRAALISLRASAPCVACPGSALLLPCFLPSTGHSGVLGKEGYRQPQRLLERRQHARRELE